MVFSQIPWKVFKSPIHSKTGHILTKNNKNVNLNTYMVIINKPSMSFDFDIMEVTRHFMYGWPFVSKLWHDVHGVFCRVYLLRFLIYGLLSHIFVQFQFIHAFKTRVYTWPSRAHTSGGSNARIRDYVIVYVGFQTSLCVRRHKI